MDRKLLELYTDFILGSFSYITATGMSEVSDGQISHDKVTRFLRSEDFTSSLLWRLVKKTVREVESDEDGAILIDDTIEEKPYTDENDIVNWYYDHSRKQIVKGINIITALYYIDGISLPISFDVVKKTIRQIDQKTGREVKKSDKNKNQIYQEILKTCKRNNIKYKYVLNDIWYGSKENMNYVKAELGKDFIMPIKGNRKVAFSKQEKLRGKYKVASECELKHGLEYKIYLEGVQMPLLLIKEILKKEDGTQVAVYLVTSDLALRYHEIITIYQRRLKVEEFYRSLKSNTGLAKSPTKIQRTQINHIFSSIYAYYKLERLKIKNKMNHYAMRARFYYNSIKIAFREVQILRLQLAA